jgi:predicted acylesterase/phospholipase RssA
MNLIIYHCYNLTFCNLKRITKINNMSIDFKNLPNADYKKLVISGGGPKGLAILGALHFINENNGLNNIQEYWGTSVGSVICLLLLLGYSPFDAFHKFFIMEDITQPSLDIQKILEASGLFPIEVFGDKIRHLLQEKMGKGINPTFLDLYHEFGKKIYIIGANTTTQSGECFSVDTTPNMLVIDAIEISCDLPLIFSKKIYNGNVYVDGGIFNMYPINMADNGYDNTLGICVWGNMGLGNNSISWIYNILYMPIKELHKERVSRLSDKCTNIELIINNINIIEMAPNQKKKIDMFSSGYQQTRDIFIKMYNENLEIKQKLSNIAENTVETNGWDQSFDWDF